MARFAQPGDLDGGDVQGLDLRLLVHTQHDRVVSNRLLQCVTPRIFGGGASDAVTTAAWSTVRDRPDRCSSSRPALSDLLVPRAPGSPAARPRPCARSAHSTFSGRQNHPRPLHRSRTHRPRPRPMSPDQVLRPHSSILIASVAAGLFGRRSGGGCAPVPCRPSCRRSAVRTWVTLPRSRPSVR